MDPPLNEEEEAQQSAPQRSAPVNIATGRAAYEDDVTRGRTIMRRLLKRRAVGIKTALIWNHNDQPVGKTAKDLTGYIGCMARQKIPITITDWRQVKDKHEDIWLEILVS